MAELTITLLTSVICIVLGVGIIIGAAVAYPFIDSTLNNLQTTTSNSLAKADSAISSAGDAINQTQGTLGFLSSASNISVPALSATSQLTGSIASNLTSIGSTVQGVGQTLSGISIGGSSPFSSVGNTLASIGQPIATAADSLQNVSSRIDSIRQQTSDTSSRLDGISTQLGNIGSNLSDLKTAINDAQNSLSNTFNTIHLVAILGIVGLIGLGVFVILIGLSLFSLRRRSLELNRSLYRLIAKYPV